MSSDTQEALDAYWSAQTADEERIAYARLGELGLPPAYGEDDIPPDDWE